MASTENISVHVRVRPLNESEKAKGKSWKVDNNTIVQADPLTGNPVNDAIPYTLNAIFDGQCSTAEVYRYTTRDLIHQVIEGFNSTVFAYGQTSSGKTHTMRGTDTEPGIIPLAVREIFDLIATNKDREFLLRMSYMEQSLDFLDNPFNIHSILQLYNEDINDLLAPENVKLPVHESKESGVYVAGLHEGIVSTPDQVLDLLAEGERHRHVGETKMNKNSSRSHTIFRMIIESRSKVNNPSGDAIRVSVLTLVDLAGSERMSKTGAEGQRAKEGAAINKSLLTLGTVINKLSEAVAAPCGPKGHIPYRDSKLTRILQPSLGGNAKTAIICAITPAAMHVEESHSTLRFACRAKRVVNNATVNEVLSDAAVLKRQAKEIEDLRNALQSSGNVAHIEDEINRLRAELLRRDQETAHMSSALAAEKEQRERAQRKIDTMTRLMLEGTSKTVSSNGGSPSGRDGMTGGGGEDGSHTLVVKRNKRDNRRETWCPGASQRKRPLLPNIAGITALDDEDGGGVGCAQRRSDGGALLPWSSAAACGSPPRKLQCTNANNNHSGNIDSNSFRRSSLLTEDVGELQARVRELETANDLMQRELDALAESAQRTQQQLRDAEDELMNVADERDKMGPALKEAQWKTRQLEKEVHELSQQRDAALSTVAQMETAAVEAQATRRASAGDDILIQQLQVAREESNKLRDELAIAEKAKVELAEALAEKERLSSKVEKVKAAASEAEEKMKSMEAEMEEAKSAKKAAEDTLAEIETRARTLYEETERLRAHISDLESRKRAPLYQKRQEDELRAAVDKAAEAEVRASEAELRAKEARAVADAADKEVASLKDQIERLKTESADEIADLHEKAQVAAQKSAAEAELVATRHAEAIAAAQVREDALLAAKAAAESLIDQREATIQRLNEEIASLQESQATLNAQLEETQACADAAAQHVQFLEDKAEDEAAQAEKEIKCLQEQLQTVKAEMETALSAVAEEREAMNALTSALEQSKAELEAKVATAAGAINAAEELKELKRKFKEETARLNQALKAACAGTKGTEKAADRAAKESERLRAQIKELEGKLRTAVAEKSTAQLEKAAIDRELKSAQAQLEKLNKNMSRIAGVEERKRETVMQDFNQAKTKLATLEESLAQTQSELEGATFQLDAKQAEVDHLITQLEDAQRAGEEASLRVEELSAQLDMAENDREILHAELDTMRSELAVKTEHAAAASDKIVELQCQLQEAMDAKAMIAHEKSAVETELESVHQQLAAAVAQLPQIAELHDQLENTRNELVETKETTKARIQGLEADVALLESKMEEIAGAAGQDKAAAEAAVAEANHKVMAAQATIEEKSSYASSLESQMNDILSENMEIKATLEGTSAQCKLLEGQLASAVAAAEAAGQAADLAAVDLEAAHQSIKAMEIELAATRDNAEQTAVHIKTLQAQALESAQYTAQLEVKIESLESDVQTVKAAHQAHIAVLEQEVAKWQSVAQELQTSQTNVHEEMLNSLRQAQAMVAKLEVELANAQGTAQHHHQSCQALETRLSEIQTEFDTLSSQTSALEASLAEERAMVSSLKTELEVERAAGHARQALADSYAMEESERKIATLNSRIQSLQGQLHRATEEAQALQQRAFAAAGPDGSRLAALEQRCVDLENDLRKSKRREEKLQALQYRLKEDLKQCGGNVGAFDQLRDVRSLEYELDRMANKASRDKAALKQALDAAQNRVMELESSIKTQSKQQSSLRPLADKENVFIQP